MAINRLAQYTAETRVTTDLALISNAPQISTVQKYTGSYAYRFGTNVMPFGYSDGNGLSAVRFGWWQYMGTTDAFSTSYLVVLSNSSALGTGTESLYLVLDIGSSQMELRRPLGNSTYETLASAPLPTQYTTTGQWFHVGYCVKLHATDGFFSMYVDGDRVFNYVGDTRLSRWLNPNQTFATSAIYWTGPGAGATSFGIQG